MVLTKKIISIVSILVLTVVAAVSCQQERDAYVYEETEEPGFTKAVAVLQPTAGNDVSGIVYFNLLDNGVEIIADVDGLEPGNHGFHIHQFGDLRAEDGTSAGGHFNPHGVVHGAPTDSVRHVGDLGNIVAMDDQTAHYERIDTTISFTGKTSIIGRAVVIHEGEDDFTSQPTGAAGSRLAVGVIGIANEQYNGQGSD